MKAKIFFTAVSYLLLNISLFAQPIVKTLAPTVVPDFNNYCYFDMTYFNGSVLPDGQSYTVYFEFGTDPTYGYTTPSTTVSGTTVTPVSLYESLLTLLNAYSGDIYSLTIHHRLVAVDALGNKYYGRDVPVPVNYFYNPVRVLIQPMDYYSPSSTSLFGFGLTPKSVPIGWQCLELNGTINTIPGDHWLWSNLGDLTIRVYGYSVCHFSYNGEIFKQVSTYQGSEQWDKVPQNLIQCNAMGTINNGTGTVYEVRNLHQTQAANLTIYGTVPANITVPAWGVTTFIAPYDIELDYGSSAIMIVNKANYTWGNMSLLNVAPVSTDATTATFEIQNNENAAHEFVLKNSEGTEYTYAMAANSYQTVTLPKTNYDVYVDISFAANLGYTAMTGNHYKLYSVSPGNCLVPSVVSASASSSTSLTLNGAISNSSTVDINTGYYFIYGTDPDNLNQTTSVQNGTVPADGSLNVSAAVTGLTDGMLYYYKLAAGGNQSSSGRIFLSSPIPAGNLKLWLRSDMAVTSSGTSVSGWGDISGWNNDASQSTSANQPAVTDNVINGKPAISFNGTSSKLTLPTSVKLGIQSSPYEIFIAAKSGSGNIQFLIAGGAKEQFEYHLNGDAGARFIPFTSLFLDKGTAADYTDGQPHVFSARASSGGGAVRVDGVDGGSSTNNLLSSNGSALLIGARSDNTYYLNGSIAEVIIYNTNLSSAERNTVEQYLASRYNITSGVLPVELTSFTASAKGNSVQLNWQTATEVNNYGFEIERTSSPGFATPSLNKEGAGGGWEKVGFVPGNGNSNSPKDYSFTDNLSNLSILESCNIQYRLKQIDTDGNYEYYPQTAEVNLSITDVDKEQLPIEFALEQNYPNPFNPVTSIKYSIASAQYVSLKVYNILGNEVAVLVNEHKTPGNYQVKFDGGSLSSGMYIYKLTAGSFTLTKKFILMK